MTTRKRSIAHTIRQMVGLPHQSRVPIIVRMVYHASTRVVVVCADYLLRLKVLA